MYGLNINEVRQLQESSILMDLWANESCLNKVKGGMEEWGKANHSQDISCDWYHSTWQYLRLLNMVAVPNWYAFYKDAIIEVLKDKPNANVFISACADFGMLAKLHESIKETQTNPSITIYDICETPLKSAQWYADRNGLSINCKTANIIEDDIIEAPFDLIITDEFLTVLKDEYKALITSKWKKILKHDGVLITTAMIGKPTTQELRTSYANRARDIISVYGDMLFPNNNKENIVKKIEIFANLHTRHMIKDQSTLETLFKDYKYFQQNAILTPGECVNPTQSFQIVAIA
ncbi:hypothetical protein [Pelosinus fermentans]|uniref:Methyltransferase domain-containing protein n=1 Tax=Pelosinus fermentans B4 TaxID=1149862 RepID=I9L8F3_9FIRM|nr:hypothetical protein [Pelosinus fermentans]EIW16654.1 hypothetical protein FB4_0674 [Pelosinus fermentans B4]EIW22857.1 hypothetical protein FA11_0440 [Pelosinus fermentans A11]